MIIVVIGRNTHSVIDQDFVARFKNYLELESQRKKAKSEEKTEPPKPLEIPNSQEGAETLLNQTEARKIKSVSFVGNRQWAIGLASFLTKRGLEVRRISLETKKGQKGSFIKTAVKIFDQNFIGRPFFTFKQPLPSNSSIGWYETATQYLVWTNNVRTEKHHLLSCLSVLFPEVVKPSREEIMKGKPIPEPMPPDLWTKKMKVVLENPNPLVLQSSASVPAPVRELAKKSLGLFVLQEDRQKYLERFEQHWATFIEAREQKQAALADLRKTAGEHPLYLAFNSDSALVLAGLIGWRTWPHWRELRSFAGLAVTRLDSKGNPRISRVRGEIRQYLFILLRTTVGKDLTKDIKGRNARVKKIVRLLKYLRKNYLKPAGAQI